METKHRMNHSLIRIERADHEGRGIGRIGGKTVFVAGALPDETVSCRIVRRHSRFDEAETLDVHQASPWRVAPFCPHAGECGGCSLQHLDFSAQVAFKQQALESQLQRLGKVSPQQMLAPVYGTAKHYRSRTRLAVTSAGVLGYRKRHGHDVVAVSQCAVLPKPVSDALPVWAQAVAELCQRAPKAGIHALEIHCGDNVSALMVCSNRAIPAQAWRDWSDAVCAVAGSWQTWQQIGKNEPVRMGGTDGDLCYRLSEFALSMPFVPGDFTQANRAVNEILVARAVRLLQPQANEHIVDLFCGLGNFSLPLARSGADIQGIEGLPSLTRRAAANARANGIKNARFATADLFEVAPDAVWTRADKILLDPPRAGAYAVVQSLSRQHLPQRVVYVSCNPATLARDAAVLVEKGYVFAAAGLVNMFPHTGHSEAVACFERVYS